jgi:hypothetical protein
MNECGRSMTRNLGEEGRWNFQNRRKWGHGVLCEFWLVFTCYIFGDEMYEAP